MFDGQPTVVAFDVLPNGAAVPNGTIITNQYASLGVTFTSPAPAGGPVATDPANETSSPPNALVGLDPRRQEVFTQSSRASRGPSLAWCPSR
jgi:hypothetical protein